MACSQGRLDRAQPWEEEEVEIWVPEYLQKREKKEILLGVSHLWLSRAEPGATP